MTTFAAQADPSNEAEPRTVFNPHDEAKFQKMVDFARRFTSDPERISALEGELREDVAKMYGYGGARAEAPEGETTYQASRRIAREAMWAEARQVAHWYIDATAREAEMVRLNEQAIKERNEPGYVEATREEWNCIEENYKEWISFSSCAAQKCLIRIIRTLNGHDFRYSANNADDCYEENWEPCSIMIDGMTFTAVSATKVGIMSEEPRIVVQRHDTAIIAPV